MKNQTIRFALQIVLIFSLQAFSTPVHAAGIVLYANPEAKTSGSCDTWENACTLQYALSLASSGDEIWVMQGTHLPTTGTDRTITFQLKDSVALYGGFTGTEKVLEDRNPVTYPTILSGDIGVSGKSDNSYHVVKGAYNATLDGFTITGGNADGTASAYNQDGGGLFNNSEGLLLSNVIFSKNFAGSDILLGAGGGMYSASSSPTLTNVTFSQNSALGEGGGMYTWLGSPTLTKVTFNENSASSNGGGLYVSSSPSAVFLTNITFSGNSAVHGGGMINSGSNLYLYNVTLNGNTASGKGGGFYNYQSSLHVYNTIFWGNTAAVSTDAQFYNERIEDSVILTYSIVQDGCPSGITCSQIITSDPLLGILGDYGGLTQTIPLLFGSSAIDMGANYFCPATDQRGVSRPQGEGYCDIGAFEFNEYYTPPSNLQASDGTYTDKVALTWTASSGATSYNVYRSGSLGGARTLLGSPVATAFADSTVTPGLTYYYWVKACNGLNCSGYSTVDTGWRKLSTPLNLQASDGTNADKVLLTWTASSGAISYNVYRAPAATAAKTLLGWSSGLTFNDTFSVPGIIYYYWVKACLGTGCSVASTANTGWRMLTAPANVQASDGTYTGKVQLTWTASSGATSYNVYRAATSGGTRTLLGSPVGISFGDTTATPGVTYYYWVKACKQTRCSVASTANTGWRMLTAPANVQASDGTYTTKVQLSWTASSGATSYNVYRASSSIGTKTLLGSPVVNSFADTTATPGVTFYYWVKACRGPRCSVFSLANTGWRKP